MARTAYLLRRTLLCAVFACPLAAVCFPCAAALTAVCTLTAAGTCARVPWYSGPRRGGASRAALPLCAGLALAAGLRRACLPLLPAGFERLYLPLCMLSGLLLQGSLLLRSQKRGGRRLFACLPLLLLFTVCMR